MHHLSYLQSKEACALSSSEYHDVIIDYIISDVDHPIDAATQIGDLILPGKKEVALDLLQSQKGTLFGDTLLLICMHNCAVKGDQVFALKITKLLIGLKYWDGLNMIFPGTRPNVCEALIHASQIINRSEYANYWAILQQGANREPYELKRSLKKKPSGAFKFSLPVFGDFSVPPPDDFHKF